MIAQIQYQSTTGTTANGTMYRVTGTAGVPSNSTVFGPGGTGYCRTKISVQTRGNICNTTPAEITGPEPGCIPFGSPCFYDEFPINEFFWYCVVAQPPEFQSNQIVLCSLNAPVAYQVQMVLPLQRIPQEVGATGLPPGLTLEFNPEPEGVQPVGTYYEPVNYLPVIRGTPTVSGTFNAELICQNLVGQSATPITIVVQAGPAINISTDSLTGFSANQGAASASKSFLASGTSLTEGITISSPPEFQVSADNTSFLPTITVPQIGGAANGTVYARIASTAPVGAVFGGLTITSPGAASREVTLSGEVLPALTRPVTFSVNLNILIAFGQFNPAFHTVQIRGDFNNFDGWDLADDNADGIYSGTFTISGAQGLSQKYKFFIPTLQPSPWESIPDRTFTLGAANTAQILNTAYFNNKETLPGVILETSAPSTFYVGTTAVSRIHLGEDQVFP